MKSPLVIRGFRCEFPGHLAMPVAGHRPVTQDAGSAPHDDKRPTRFVGRSLKCSLFLASEATVPRLGGGVGRAPVVTKLICNGTGALSDAAARTWVRSVRGAKPGSGGN